MAFTTRSTGDGRSKKVGGSAGHPAATVDRKRGMPTGPGNGGTAGDLKPGIGNSPVTSPQQNKGNKSTSLC